MSVHISNDPRALAREAVALAAQGGAAAGKPARGHGKGTFVLGVLNVTADQLTSSAAAIVEGAKAATADLTQRLPAVMAQPMPFRDVKPGTADFATGMAGVQQSYGPQLGHLSTD